MVPLTPEQKDYKEKTLVQLQANKARLEASLGKEARLQVAKSIQRQLSDIDGHISRLQDELSGKVVPDEPVADELFKKAAQALAKEKFYLAKRKINKLETIEPFYPGLDRLRHEAETRQVSRRTRSIAEGKATGYPGTVTIPDSPTVQVTGGPPATVIPQRSAGSDSMPVEDDNPWWRSLFQFHIVVSCMVVILLLCVVFGMAGFTILQWLVQGT
jgi:hypothetical protein